MILFWRPQRLPRLSLTWRLAAYFLALVVVQSRQNFNLSLHVSHLTRERVWAVRGVLPNEKRCQEGEAEGKCGANNRICLKIQRAWFSCATLYGVNKVYEYA